MTIDPESTPEQLAAEESKVLDFMDVLARLDPYVISKPASGFYVIPRYIYRSQSRPGRHRIKPRPAWFNPKA